MGSKAPCAYPKRYRILARPSAASEPSHPPNGVVTAIDSTGVQITYGLVIIGSHSLPRWALYPYLMETLLLQAHVSSLIGFQYYRFESNSVIYHNGISTLWHGYVYLPKRHHILEMTRNCSKLQMFLDILRYSQIFLDILRYS